MSLEKEDIVICLEEEQEEGWGNKRMKKIRWEKEDE